MHTRSTETSGFGMHIAKTQKNLKWLCVPSAGVDYLMKPGAFANEECLQDRKNCPRRAARKQQHAPPLGTDEVDAIIKK